MAIFSISVVFGQSLQWRPLHDPGVGGWVTSLSFNPSDPSMVLAGGDILGLARSSNGGLSWKRPSVPPGSYMVEDFTWHPQSGNSASPHYGEVWAGTMAGPWKSTDFGQTWVFKRTGMSQPNGNVLDFRPAIQKILVDPLNSRRLLAFFGTHRFEKPDGFYTDSGKVFESLDGGENWAELASIVPGTDSKARLINAAAYQLTGAGGATTLYVASRSGFFKSTDNGLTWAEKSAGLPAPGRNIRSLAVHPTDGLSLWITVSGGVYKSTDGGESWVASSTGITSPTSGTLDAIIVSPADPSILFTSKIDEKTLYRSTNGGASWVAQPTAAFGPSPYPVYRDVRCFAAHPTDAGVFVAGTPTDIWKVSNATAANDLDGVAPYTGPFWENVSSVQRNGGWAGTGFSGQVVTQFRWNPYDNTQAAMAAMDSGKFVSFDNLQSWRFAGGGRYKGINDWFAQRDFSFSSVPGHWYAMQGQYGGWNGLFRTTNAGASWTSVPTPSVGGVAATGDPNRVHVHRTDTNRIWVVWGSKLYYSPSAGASGTWTQLAADSTVYGTIADFVADPADTTGLTFWYGGSKGLFRTTDGANFTQVAPNSSVINLSRVKLDPTNPNRIWVVNANNTSVNTYNTGLWRLVYTPATDTWTWTNIASWGNPSSPVKLIVDVDVDPTNGNRIVAATTQDNYTALTYETGVWVNDNNGATNAWRREVNGLGVQRVRTVNFRPGTSELVAGTMGGGYFIANTDGSVIDLSPVPDVIPFAITSISPTQGDGTNNFALTVNGSGFLAGSEVRLRRAGAADIVGYSTSVNSQLISCRVDTAAAEKGYWDVVVRLPDGTEEVFPNAFFLPAGGSPGGRQTLYTTGFANADGLTLGTGWAVGAPAQSGVGGPGSAFEGSTVLGTYLSGNYVGNLNTTATLRAVSTLNRTVLQLEFRRWLGIAYNQGGNPSSRHADYARIHYSINGTTWTQLWATSTSVSDAGWQSVTFSLPSTAENQSALRIRFQLQTDGSMQSFGWNIDDLKITGFAPTSPTPLPPVFGSYPSLEPITLGQPFSYSVAVTDGDTAASSLTYTASGLPPGVLLTTANGIATLSGTPGMLGNFDVTLSVTDGTYTTRQVFSLSVIPVVIPPPVITFTKPATSVARVWLGTGLAIEGTLTRFNPEGSPSPLITWSVIAAPIGAPPTFSPADSLDTFVRFPVAGDYILRVLVQNDTALPVESRLEVQVVDAATSLADPRGLSLWLKMDESTGTIASDSSGLSSNGTLLNGATWLPSGGRFRGGLSFDGTNDYARIPDADTLDGINKMSFSLWVWPGATNSNARGLLTKRLALDSGHAWAIFLFSDNRIFVDFHNSNNRFGTDQSLPVNQWTHVAVVYDGTLPEAQRAKVYLNGVLVKTAPETSATLPNSPAPVTLGLLNEGFTPLFAGRLDEVLIYHGRALSDSDVAAIATGVAVNVGPAITLSHPGQAETSVPFALAATVTDDGQPAPPGAWTLQWTCITGPGTATFAPPDQPNTQVTLGVEGEHLLRLSADDGEVQTFSEIVISAVATPPFLLWRKEYFTPSELADPSLEASFWGAGADPDGDGYSNFMEYALGSTPDSSDSRPAVGTQVVNAKLQITFLRARSELIYRIETSNDLVTWVEAAINPGTVGEEVTWIDQQATEPRRFARLRVIVP